MQRLATALVMGISAVLLSTFSAAQDGLTPDGFSNSTLVKAGDVNASEGRLYPSPVMHDIDGDGLADLLIGDLSGIITVARRLPGEGLPRFATEERLKDLDGADLKFHNW